METQRTSAAGREGSALHAVGTADFAYIVGFESSNGARRTAAEGVFDTSSIAHASPSRKGVNPVVGALVGSDDAPFSFILKGGARNAHFACDGVFAFTAVGSARSALESREFEEPSLTGFAVLSGIVIDLLGWAKLVDICEWVDASAFLRIVH